jgi:hypothetical protein
MERLRYRSTSLTDLLAELHQRDLLDEARRQRSARALRPGRPHRLLGLFSRGPRRD